MFVVSSLDLKTPDGDKNGGLPKCFADKEPLISVNSCNVLF